MCSKKQLLSAFLAALFIFSAEARAAVSAEEATQLGATLTPLGGEKAGNAEKTIPEWTGGLTEMPTGAQAGHHYPDPFADEKEIATITVENMDRYAAKLTAGHIALLKKYPSYKMRIFPTHRTASAPPRIYEAVRHNATGARLHASGDSVENAAAGIPFPIPKNGLEIIWNHLLRYRGQTVKHTSTEAIVYPNGAKKLTKNMFEVLFSYGKLGATPQNLDNMILYFKQHILTPAALAGQKLLVYETLNQVKEPRQSWLYNPGERRVRRAPEIAYDFPAPTTDGLRLLDEFDTFNGATDRYEWKLVGKEEKYVPYNSYVLHSNKIRYEDILRPYHVNPDLARYELHRVWVVDATLKKGKRHIFPRRTFYVDEDSWQILGVDNYDKNGNIWRVTESHPINFVEVPTIWTVLEAHYDLSSGRYTAAALTNEEEAEQFDIKMDLSEFTPAALDRAGIR